MCMLRAARRPRPPEPDSIWPHRIPDTGCINLDLAVVRSIATLTLNRPDKFNSMSDDMRSEFIDPLERPSVDRKVRT